MTLCEVRGCEDEADGKAMRSLEPNRHVCRKHWREWYQAATMPVFPNCGPRGRSMHAQECLAVQWGWGYDPL